MRRLLTDPLARLRERADEREAAGLRRRLRFRRADTPLLDLAGNDYLGLTRDPRVIAGGVEALQRWGAGSTGSRLVTGSTELHGELESALAAHCEAQAALVFSSGYLANLGAIVALSGPDTLVVSDAHNHASVVDACRLSRARVAVVPHRDVSGIERALDERSEHAALVVSDAVFSVDGDAAPIVALHDVCQRAGALLVVDEAHALGVVGNRGEGLVAAHGLAGATDIVRTVTLSKALGSQGGAVLGSIDVIEHLVDAARPFIFDTGLAPACVGAALAALRVLDVEPQRASAARGNAGRLAAALGRPNSDAAVVAVPVGSPEAALAAAERCAAAGVHVGCFRPPSVPDGVSRLRLTARADLTDVDLERAIQVVAGALARN
ncbi:MAG: 8-amino-7-oxononanoate synthase [Frankiales bacterium]|nr:8-amino-7-oxononanoate synthase [Frankiales bacterium]